MRTYKINAHTYVKEISSYEHFIMKSVALVFSIESRIEDFYTSKTKPFEKRYFIVKNDKNKYLSKRAIIDKAVIASVIRNIAEEMDKKAFMSTGCFCATDIKINCNVPSLI